ncbi:glycoside hydrolase family 20 protein [candidate division KSB1 bacterium]|nr:glycoside hydrolase family 20 protein [candidate division KSB1 bacterium]
MKKLTKGFAVAAFNVIASMTFSQDANMGSIDMTDLSLIPLPSHTQISGQHFAVTPETRISIDPGHAEAKAIGAFLADKINAAAGFNLVVVDGSPSKTADQTISLTLSKAKKELGKEGYELEVKPNAATIRAPQPAGLFYGVQTLRQLLPPEIESTKPVSELKIPCVKISDRPRFPWRGMLLDCGRHFMTKDFVKRYIDLLAYHKMNRLHWHLTEDQGWRIEIKKYPKLTEVGAWRKYEDGTVYGGFYTQEDIKEVVAYAQSRYVTIVPEIEMPGHSVAALAAYPEYSCTGGPFEVETQWGVHKEVYCAGNDGTFLFLEDILTEVLALFPSEYIHIGGDECPKDRWKVCEKCQARIKHEGLQDEHELQSYFIRRIEKFLLSKNRRLIGWDEILEGGLAPAATVQSWRGVDGAIAAAKSGHNAIVSPTSHAYFDYDIGTTDLRKAYSFEPIPPELTEKERKHILGGECNMWTERAPQETIDSKVFPRLVAMAECLWSFPEHKDFANFHQRLQRHYQRLDALGVKYGAEARPVSILANFDPAAKKFTITLEAGEDDLLLYYSLNGSEPALISHLYQGPFALSDTVIVKARAFKAGNPYGEIAERRFVKHAALGKKIDLSKPYSHKYTGGGDFALTNGMRGTLNFRDGLWQAFEQDDLEAIVDLEKLTSVQRITTGFLQNSGSWIFFPTSVEYAVSDDGKAFQMLAILTHDVSPKQQDAIIKDFVFELPNVPARYVRVRAKNIGVCPAWHPGAGGKAWIFVDEIMIE